MVFDNPRSYPLGKSEDRNLQGDSRGEYFYYESDDRAIMKHVIFNNFDAPDTRKGEYSAMNGASLEPGTFCRKLHRVTLRIRYGVLEMGKRFRLRAE
jgi:hypothetical protein